jgi:group I intron endonuclease
MKDSWPDYGQTCGIYAIEHVDSGKRYVGQAQDVRKRWDNHLTVLRHGKHRNAHLQSAWSKHSESAFKFVVLEECETSELDAREQAWIDALESVRNGYNLSPTAGGGTRGIRFSAEVRARMGDAQRKANERPEVRANKVAARSTPESKARRSKAATEALSAPEVRAKLSKSVKAACARPEVKAKRSKSQKETWTDPEVKARRTEGMKSTWADQEGSAKMRGAIQKNWSDPEKRQRMLGAMRIAAATDEVKARAAAGVKKTWADPEVRKRRADGIRAAAERRRELANKEPNMKMVRTNYYYPVPMLERLKTLSTQTGTPMAELIRRAVENMLKENKQ